MVCLISQPRWQNALCGRFQRGHGLYYFFVAPTPTKSEKSVGDEPYLYVEDRVMGKGETIAVMKFEVIGNTGDTSTLTGTVTTASKTDDTEISVSDRGGPIIT